MPKVYTITKWQILASNSKLVSRLLLLTSKFSYFTLFDRFLKFSLEPKNFKECLQKGDREEKEEERVMWRRQRQRESRT